MILLCPDSKKIDEAIKQLKQSDLGLEDQGDISDSPWRRIDNYVLTSAYWPDSQRSTTKAERSFIIDSCPSVQYPSKRRKREALHQY